MYISRYGRFKIAKAGYGDLVEGSFKQYVTKNARAGFKSMAGSFGVTLGVTAVVNFGYNLYENNGQIDRAMLKDTAIDILIGVGSYYLTVGTVSLAVAGLALAGVALPGVIVVGGVILLSVGYDWLIREIT